MIVKLVKLTLNKASFEPSNLRQTFLPAFPELDFVNMILNASRYIFASKYIFGAEIMLKYPDF